jgi:hypothetical protein
MSDVFGKKHQVRYDHAIDYRFEVWHLSAEFVEAMLPVVGWSAEWPEGARLIQLPQSFPYPPISVRIPCAGSATFFGLGLQRRKNKNLVVERR